MARQIFVNLPVGDLDRARTFFTALGFGFDARFTGEGGTCMVVADDIFVMLLTEPFFATFTDRPVAKDVTEAIVCIAIESRAAVDDLVARAVAAGATVPREPQDHGFMYGHGFRDPDGHLWEFIHISGSPPAG